MVGRLFEWLGVCRFPMERSRDCRFQALSARIGSPPEFEPAEGGRPPVAPCKRRAERSDARRAAWGSEPHHIKKARWRRANERRRDPHHKKQQTVAGYSDVVSFSNAARAW